MNIKNSKKIVPATVFAAIIVLLAFAVMSTTVSAEVSKELDPVEGDLGEEVTVKIDVTVTAEDGAVTVNDTLPSELTYIGKFTVNGISATPTVDKQEISYAIEDPGLYTIEFDAKVTEASWEDLDVYNEVVVTNVSGDTSSATAEFTILPFEELHKNVGIPKADVVFSFDLTGSMSDVIDEAKTQASDIIDNVTALVADAAFGVVTHVDYPHMYTDYCGYSATYGSGTDYAYKTDLAITENAASAISTISGLVTYSGGDGPQDYSRVLNETQFLAWRTGAKKIVVLFGDNLPHDCDFWSYTTGGDPGPDEIANTPDDLEIAEVVANLTSEGITVLAVDCSGGTYAGFYQYLADETGGEYYELEDAEDIPEAIKELLKAEAEEALTIEEKTETQWAVVIDIVNTFSYTMEDAVITDRFGAEIEIDELAEITHGTASWDYGPGKGKPNKSKKVFLTWDIWDLLPDETARLILLVSTDLNPAGKQEYTSPGEDYEMNSGATLKFIDSDQDMQLSAVTDSIYVTVLP